MSYFLVGSAIASVAISVAGAGLSYYGAQQQASNAQAVADYNWRNQQRQNQVQAAIQAQQSAWQQQALRNNQISAQNNATALQNEARATESAAREDARRTRQANEQALAKQRARYAKSGVTSEGSPLAIMAETAGLLELGVQDAAYKAELESKALDRKAQISLLEADQSVFDAGIAEYESAAQRAGLAIDLNTAKVDRLSGQQTAQGYKMASYSSLLSGFGDAVNIGSSYAYQNRNSFGKTKTPKVG